MRQIKDDLTFEVYNLYPDYDYPVKIIRLETEVTDTPLENKFVSVTIELNDADGVFDGASEAYLRIPSSIGTFSDMRLYPISGDEGRHILKGMIEVSKYAKSGYWHTDQIIINRLSGHQRFEGIRDFGWKR